jgi:UDP-N-acetylenolpyruvoylglucosamine reductase
VHANFIVTTEGATAADVIELIDVVQARVLEHAGIALVPEVVRPHATEDFGVASGGH